MSYTHTHLPELLDLKKSLQLNPSLLDYYLKFDGLVGPTESIKYIEKLKKA